MAVVNGTRENIHIVLVIGDNHLAIAILNGLALTSSSLELHHAFLPTSTPRTDTSFQLHRNDLSPAALIALFEHLHPDIIFSTHAAGSFELQKRIVDAAIAARVPRFVAPEFSQDCLNEAIRARLPPYRTRARVIRYLVDRATAAVEPFSWAAVATGVALEPGLLSGSLGFELQWHSATVHGTGEERFAASSAAWIGDVAAAMVARWSEIRNRYLFAAGMIVTAQDVVRALEKRTGSQWEVGYVDVEAGVREAERRLKRGFPDAGMFLMERNVLYDPAVNAVKPFLHGEGIERLGLQGESLEAVIQKVVHDYEHHSKGGCGCD